MLTIWGKKSLEEKCTRNMHRKSKIKSKLTFVVKSKTHVHQSFGRRKILGFVTFEQADSEILDQSEEDGFCYLLVVHSLRKNEIIFFFV